MIFISAFNSFLLITAIFASPTLDLKWFNKLKKTLTATVSGKDELVDKCLKGGLEVRYRFEIKICKQRDAWYDNCGDTAVQINSVSYDPITQEYSVSRDRHNDADLPESIKTNLRDEALALLSRIDKLEIATLDDADELSQSPRAYIGINANFTCKGEFSGTLRAISTVLTLGLVRVSGFETGWTNFSINEGH